MGGWRRHRSAGTIAMTSASTRRPREDALPPALQGRLAAGLGFGFQGLDGSWEEGQAAFLKLEEEQVHLSAAEASVAGEGVAQGGLAVEAGVEVAGPGWHPRLLLGAGLGDPDRDPALEEIERHRHVAVGHPDLLLGVVYKEQVVDAHLAGGVVEGLAHRVDVEHREDGQPVGAFEEAEVGAADDAVELAQGALAGELRADAALDRRQVMAGPGGA